MASLRVVLDTNVFMSGLVFPGGIPGKILQAWRLGSVDVVSSKFILDELRRVLPRLAHRHQLTLGEIDDLVDVLSIQTEIIEPIPITNPALRDADDQPVLGTLLAALAKSAVDYLITGDKDLIVLANRYPILTPAEFWTRHGGF